MTTFQILLSIFITLCGYFLGMYRGIQHNASDIFYDLRQLERKHPEHQVALLIVRKLLVKEYNL